MMEACWFVGASGKQTSTRFMFLVEFNNIHETTQIKSPNLESDSQFGTVLDISGYWIVVGVPFSDSDANHNAGAMFHFEHEAMTHG